MTPIGSHLPPRALAIGGLAVAAALSAATLKLLPSPYIWISALWTLVFLALLRLERSRGARLAWLYCSAIVFGIGVAEAGLSPGATSRVKHRSRPDEPDSLLGWRPPPGVIRASERMGGTLLYDVTYTIDSTGRRVTPRATGRLSRGCVLFFADSYTFGEGLGDDETLPYVVGTEMAAEFDVFNLSAPGYGAEHMLASIESGRVGRLNCRPTHAIYQALLHHVFRSAGLVDYSRRGPHYETGPDGTPRYRGTGWPVAPPTRRRAVVQQIHQQLLKSHVYRALLPAPWPSAADLRRYLAIVRRSRDLLEEQHPGVAFHVLVWNPSDLGRSNNGVFNEFFRGLSAIDPGTRLVDDILPGYRLDPRRYQLHEGDLHPNAEANRWLAHYIATRVLTPGRVGRSGTP